jgi:signal transduction histidine kinase
MLDDFGLPEALRSYLRTFSKRTGIAAQFIQNGKEQRLPQAAEVCVYRIVQEALTNARNVIVTFSQTDDGLEMTIDDDGHGIDQQISRFGTSATHGLGVIGMRERVQALGGTFALESRRDGGTRVAVRLPGGTRAADLSDKSDPELLAG